MTRNRSACVSNRTHQSSAFPIVHLNCNLITARTRPLEAPGMLPSIPQGWICLNKFWWSGILGTFSFFLWFGFLDISWMDPSVALASSSRHHKHHSHCKIGTMVSLDSLHTTLLASIRSVGTAVTLAAVGFYLHQRGCIIGDGKKTLAVICQQVQFPLFLFTKILYCNQNWSTKACPDVTSSLRDAWLLLFWPFYVVGMGFAVGYAVAKITHTPSIHVRAVLAGCAFPNNTALPITLLTVISSNFPANSNLGSIDPTLFLSVYLLVYPVLQWGIGGWLLAPDDIDDELDSVTENHLQVSGDDLLRKQSAPSHTNADETTPLVLANNPRHVSSSCLSIRTKSGGTRNVLNNQTRSQFFKARRCGLSSSDEGCYTSELDLNSIWKLHQQSADSSTQLPGMSYLHSRNGDFLESQSSSVSNGGGEDDYHQLLLASTCTSSTRNDCALQHAKTLAASIGLRNSDLAPCDNKTNSIRTQSSCWETLWNILDRCLFQPPVVGALLGILCACYTPLRALFVDLSRQSNAPLQWLFDGLYQVGQTAVPTNMMILGCNLSAGNIFKKNTASVDSRHDGQDEDFPAKTIGKQ